MDGRSRGRGCDVVVPSAALAGDDDPALMKFKLASSGQYDDFEALGLDMDHEVDNGAAQHHRQAWVTDEQLALVARTGYRDVGVVHDKYNIDHIRAERDADIAETRPRRDALNRTAAKAKPERRARQRARPACRLLREQRRPLHLDRGQRRRRRAARGTGTATYTGPSHGRLVRRGGNKLGEGVRRRSTSTPTSTRDYYQYHYQIFRIGNKGDGGAGAGHVKVASQRRRRHARRQGMDAKNPPGYAAASSTASSRATTTRRRPTRSARPRGRVPQHLPGLQAAEQTTGYQRRARRCSATERDDAARDVRRQQPARRRRVADAAQQTSTVVLTSKASATSAATRSPPPSPPPRRHQTLSAANAASRPHGRPAHEGLGPRGRQRLTAPIIVRRHARPTRR